MRKTLILVMNEKLIGLCKCKSEEIRFKILVDIKNLMDEFFIAQAEQVLRMRTGELRKRIYRANEKINVRNTGKRKI